MDRRSAAEGVLRTAALVLVIAVGLPGAPAPARAQDAGDGWHIPADAAKEANPVPLSPAALAKGKDLYAAKCRRCHGATGTGNGPEADPEHPPSDLTDPARASRNPDGVMFYKIWNGRTRPKMPAMKSGSTRDEVWTLIHYVKTLRR